MTRRPRMRLVRLAMVLTSGFLVALLAGCFLIPNPLAPILAQRDDSPLEVRDLRNLLLDEDSPDGTTLTAGGGYQSVEEITEFADSNWFDLGGVPSTCVANYNTSYIVTQLDEEPTQPIVDLGMFDYEYEPAGQLRASARVFDDSAAAGDFLDYVRAASQECVTGYSLAFTDPDWRIVHVESVDADDLDLPDGVAGLHHEETAYELMDVSYRDTFLQYKNVVAVVVCEVHSASPFDFDDCDRVAEAIAQRLAEASY